MKKLKVRFFGAFRKYIPSGECDLEIGDDCSVKDLKQALQSLLQSQNCYNLKLIEESAVASEDRILSADDKITQAVVALLPPVCGG